MLLRTVVWFICSGFWVLICCPGWPCTLQLPALTSRLLALQEYTLMNYSELLNRSKPILPKVLLSWSYQTILNFVGLLWSSYFKESLWSFPLENKSLSKVYFWKTTWKVLVGITRLNLNKMLRNRTKVWRIVFFFKTSHLSNSLNNKVFDPYYICMPSRSNKFQWKGKFWKSGIKINKKDFFKTNSQLLDLHNCNSNIQQIEAWGSQFHSIL